MSFFNDIVNQLFPKKSIEQESNQPLVREELKRNTEYNMGFSIWKESQEKEQVCSFILEQYEKSDSEDENISVFRTIKSGTTEGFMLRFLDKTEPQHFSFLFDHLKNRAKEKQYTIYTSDVRSFARKNDVERIERHYLKPSWRVLNTKAVNNTGKMNQLYGNITIEQHFNNDIPLFIKFVCQHYVDSKFSVPMNFNELLSHICN
ncbi:MAG: hypothetical protein ACPGLV_01590 [Bacteroidia bacterium]